MHNIKNIRWSFNGIEIQVFLVQICRLSFQFQGKGIFTSVWEK